MALSNFKKLATTTLDGKEYMFAIYEDGVEYAPGDTVMVSGATREITIERIISVEELEPNVKIRAEVIAKIEKSALAAYKHREENRKELQSLNSKINNLKEELLKHKRVFEALGVKTAVKDDPEQLSGIGFSATKHDNVIVKVKGNTERTMKVIF